MNGIQRRKDKWDKELREKIAKRGSNNERRSNENDELVKRRINAEKDEQI